jgi:hypothetical protein
MMELNKNSFFFYVLKQGGGKIDPRNIDFMIDALKEWLPDKLDGGGEFSDAWNEYREEVLRNLK